MRTSSDEGRPGRDVTINLRANRRQRALIDRAAEALGKNRSDFMLEAACREAGSVLADRDKPPAENPRLRRLLTSRAPWKR